MKGCEPFVVTLGRKQNSREWYGRGFTKTQYAENFYRALLLVVSMLDLCDEVGILKSVSDEGNYWDTRDLQVLGTEFDGYRSIVENLGKQLERAAEAADIELEGKAVGECA